MNCLYDADGVCKRCGAATRYPTLPRNCYPGLGDIVAAGLSSVGITKERAAAVARAVGLEDCGCSERQEWLNRVGAAVGIGERRDAAPSVGSGNGDPQATTGTARR